MVWEYLGIVVLLMVLPFGKCGGLATRAGNVCRLNTVMSRSCFQIISLNAGEGRGRVSWEGEGNRTAGS